jgi:cellulose synthase operon protein C
MRLKQHLGWMAICVIVAPGLIGCSRDPNVRKQKYFESGNRYYQKGQYREAAIQYGNALQVDPRFAPAHFRLGLVDEKLGAWNMAYSELATAVDLQPEFLKARLEMGNMLLAAGQLDRVKEQVEFVLRRDPANVDGEQLLANLYAAQGQTENAVREMRKAIDLAPRRSSSYINLAVLLVDEKKMAEAEENLHKAMDLDPKSTAPLLALATFYQQSRRWSDAEQQLRHAIQLDPNDANSRAALSRLYLAQNKRSDAEQTLIQAKKELGANPEGYRMLGEYYLSLGDTDRALDEFASLHRDHPKDRQVEDNYIQLLLMKGKLAEAEQLNNAILETHPRDGAALLSKGQILLKRGKNSEAAEALQQSLRNDSNNAMAHYQLGLAFDAMGKSDRAESEWQQAMRLQPDMSDAYRALAMMAMRKNDTTRLMEDSQQLIRLLPSSVDGYVFRASAEFDRELVDDAQRDLAKARQLAPQNASPYVLLGKFQLTQRRFKEAENAFEQALQRDSNSADALRGLIAAYTGEGQLDKVLPRVEAQIAKVPGNASFYYLDGIVLAKKKDLPGAENQLQKAVQLDPNSFDAIAALGQVEVARGSVDQGIADYRQALVQNPQELRFYVLLGILLESKGDWQEAERLYQRAIQLQPDYAPAANNLAYLMVQHGENIDVALGLAQAARRALPDSANVADTLGWIYCQKGVYGLAIDLLEEAVKGTPTDAVLQYHLGLAYQRNKDLEKARLHLERALQLAPDLPQGPEIRKVLSTAASEDSKG